MSGFHGELYPPLVRIQNPGRAFALCYEIESTFCSAS